TEAEASSIELAVRFGQRSGRILLARAERFRHARLLGGRHRRHVLFDLCDFGEASGALGRPLETKIRLPAVRSSESSRARRALPRANKSKYRRLTAPGTSRSSSGVQTLVRPS